MVLRRSDSKSSKDVHDPLDQNPKRTKVHAQRKFAQGSGMNSPMVTPIKDKDMVKINGNSSPQDFLPTKRPRTEDFLTFLCFRGTKALPSRLDFFNNATKFEKTEKDTSSPGTTDQAPSNSASTSEKSKTKPNMKNKVGRPVFNKIKEKLLAHKDRIRRTAQKGKSVLRSRALIEDRQKKATGKGSKKSLNRNTHRGTHPSILKRLGAARMRSGLRSSGQLPPGSDAGIKSDRKPRQIAKPRGKSTEAKGKSSLKKSVPETESSESELEKDENQDEEEEVIKDKSKKSVRISTRSRQKPARIQSKSNVKARPTRKTKEAAALYMEMLTKDLRNNEEDEEVGEDDDFEEDFDYLVPKTPSKQEAKTQKTVDQEKVKPSLKNTKKPLINRTKHVHPSILKRLGAARMRSGLRSSGQLPAGSDVGIKSDRKPRQILKRKMKPIIKGKLMRKKRKTESLSSETEQDEDEDESSKKSSRTSSQTRQNTAKNPPKSLNVHTRPSRKTKEAATLYMEMLKKDLRSPDEEEFEDEMFPEDTSSQVDETEEKVKSNKSNTKQQESKALVNKKIVLPSYGKKRVAVLRSQRILQKSRMAAKLALKRRVSSRRLRAKRSTVSELEKPSSNEEEEDDDDEVSGKSSESEAENKVKSPKRTRQISESEKVVSDSNKRGATKTTPAETSLKPSSSSPKKTVGRKAKVPKDEEESENESDNSEKETSIVNTSDKVKPVGKKAKVSTKQPDSDEEDSGVDSNKQKAADTKLKPATSSQKKSIGTKPQPSKDGQDSEDESDNVEKGETKSTAADKSKPVGKKAKVQKKQPESGSDDSEKESNMAAGKSPAQKKSLRKKGKPSVGKKESESETDDDGKGKNKSNDTEKPIAQKKLFRKKTKPPVIEQSESESDEEIDGKGLHNTPVAKLLKSGPPQQRKSLGKKGKGPVGSKDSESEIDDSEKKINKSSTEDKPRSKPGRKPSVKKINTPMHESDSEVESDDSEIETTKVSTRKSAKSEPKFPKKPIRRKTNATEDGRKSEIEPEMQTNKTNTRSSSKFELPSSKKPSLKKGQTADEKENEDTSDESEEEVSKTTRKSLKSESASQKNTALKKTKPPVDDKVSERESDDSETKETKKSSKPEPSAENKTEGGRVKPPIIGKETESESNEPEKMPNNKKSLKTEPELQQKPVEKKAKMSVDVKDNEIELEDVEMAVKISATSKMKKSVKPELPQKKTVDNKTKTATVVTIDNKTKVTTVDNKTKVAKDENEMNDSGTEPSEIVPAKTKKAIKSEIPQPKKTAVKKPVDKKQSENESDDSDLDEKEEQKDRAKQLSEPLINKGSETESKKLDNKNTTQIAKTKIETKSSPLTTRKSSVKKIENDTKIILPDDEPKNKNNSEESKKLNLESETKLVRSVQSEEDKPKKIETQSFEETTIRRQKPSLTAEAKVLKLEPPSPKKSPRSKSKFLLDDDEFDESEQEESEEEVIVAKAKTKGRKPNKINQQTKELASKKNYHPNNSAIQPTFAEKIETAKKEKPSDEFSDSEVEESEEEDIVAKAKTKGRKPNKINQQTKELASKKNYHPNNSATQPTVAQKIETAMKEKPSEKVNEEKSNKQVDSLEEMKGKSTRKSVKSLQDEILKNPSVNIKRTSNVPFGLKKCDPNMINNNITSKERSEKEIDSMSMPKQIKTEMKHEDSPKKSKDLQENFPFSEDIKTAFGFDENFDSKEKKLAEHLFQVKKEEPTLVIAGKVKDESRQNVPDKSSEKAGRKGNRLSPDEGKVKAGQKSAQSQKLLTKTQQKKANTSKCEKEKHLGKTSDSVGLQNLSNKQQMARGLTSKQEADKVKPTSNAGEKLLKIEQKLGLATPVNSRKSLEKKANVEEITFHQKIEPEIPIANTTNQNIADENNRQNVEFLSTISKQSVESDVAEFLVALQDGQILFNKGNQNFNANNIGQLQLMQTTVTEFVPTEKQETRPRRRSFLRNESNENSIKQIEDVKNVSKKGSNSRKCSTDSLSSVECKVILEPIEGFELPKRTDVDRLKEKLDMTWSNSQKPKTSNLEVGLKPEEIVQTLNVDKHNLAHKSFKENEIAQFNAASGQSFKFHNKSGDGFGITTQNQGMSMESCGIDAFKGQFGMKRNEGKVLPSISEAFKFQNKVDPYFHIKQNELGLMKPMSLESPKPLKTYEDDAKRFDISRTKPPDLTIPALQFKPSEERAFAFCERGKSSNIEPSPSRKQNDIGKQLTKVVETVKEEDKKPVKKKRDVGSVLEEMCKKQAMKKSESVNFTSVDPAALLAQKVISGPPDSSQKNVLALDQQKWMGKFSTQPDKLPTDLSIKTSAESKKMAKLMESAITDNKTLPGELYIETSNTILFPENKLTYEGNDVKSENDKQISLEKLNQQAHLSRSTTSASSESDSFKNLLISEKDMPSKSDNEKSKNSMSETWRQAFKNAKIPKPGQRSPAPHSVEPFVRRPFFKSEVETKKPQTQMTKLPNIQSFKNFQKFGSNSPSRAFTPETYEGRGHVYLSPKRNESHKDSPSKSSVSSSEELKFEPKKIETLPTKSLTQLQYEKRSSELISSLKESPPLVLDKESTIFKQNFSKLKETKSETAKPQQPQPQPQKPTEGKHLNLPLAVEHTLRKMSPTTVSKKQNPAKTIIAVEKKAVTPQTTPLPLKKPETPAEITPAVAVVNKPSASEPPPQQCSSGNMEMLVKKKVNMSTDEINRWLNDTSSSKIEHAKGCGIFQNNQCECSFRTSSASMQNSVGVNYLLPKEEAKVDHGVVEPPIQLKELDSTSKFVAETISTCKVADYREKLMSKKPKPIKIENTKDVPLNFSSKSPKGTSSDKSFKSNRSMTEEEMCEYGFRFERNLNSPRESSSEMSSPTHKEEPVTFDKPDTPTTERKAIFHQRRTGNVTKRPSLSKSPSAFSAENESSVYAFEPDLPPPTLNKPFRRRGSRVKSSDEETPSSLSIAVQVNLENEAVLECSTQTEQVGTNENEGQLFYFSLEGENPGNEQVIQGVAVKLQSTDGPDQKVLMSAELVTKPSPTFPRPTTSRSLGEVPTRAHKPEQKVRPLSSISTSTSTKPLVGTVQPTIREPVVSKDQGTLTKHEKSQQATAPLPKPAKEKEDKDHKEQKDHKDDYPPTRGKGKTRYSSSSSSVSHNEFPIPGTPACLVEAPVYYPTEKEFQDPLEYIEQITPSAQSFGICRIVPPANFKPECKVSDDMRFTAYNQYVHKMLNRWGPNVREMSAIKKYLATQSITFNQLPLIGGMEVDLPRLYQTVQSCGGLKEVIEKKRWTKVADMMKIPKSAQDRVTKLDDIYCKYLLPYDTLSHAERSKLLNEVEIEWKARERRILEEKEEEKEQHDEDKEDESDSESDSDERDECITKGKSMALNAFYRIARNTMAMWFKETNPSAKDVEAEYWKHVSTGMCHLCVHSGSIDSGTWGYGFPTAKSSSTSRHPWNLKVLTNNNGSILRSLGPIMGVTVPTLHVGMLFTACCWYRDPLSLPWIEYLHTGASKIWYGVPDSWCEELRGAVKNLLPRFCRDKKIWLASDTAMVPPELLVQQGVSLCRTVQEPGQFVLVFPKAFTSTICTGYLVSESVYFAQPSWLNTAKLIFKDIQESCEPPIFSLEKLLFNIASDIRSPVDVLMQVLPMIVELKETEVVLRKELEDLGIPETETLIVTKGRKSKASQDEIIEYECEICRGNLFLSLVTNMQAEINYCLPHAIDIIKKDSSVLKHCKLMHAFDEEEMDELIEKIKTRIETKSQKKSGKGGGSKS